MFRVCAPVLLVAAHCCLWQVSACCSIRTWQRDLDDVMTEDIYDVMTSWLLVRVHCSQNAPPPVCLLVGVWLVSFLDAAGVGVLAGAVAAGLATSLCHRAVACV